MKVITVLFAMMLFVAASFGSYTYGRENNSVNTMEMDCERTCCKKMPLQQKHSEEDKHSCCNNSICSPLSSCNYFLVSYSSHLSKSFGAETAKPGLKTQNFILNKFIIDVFQPPELNCLV